MKRNLAIDYENDEFLLRRDTSPELRTICVSDRTCLNIRGFAVFVGVVSYSLAFFATGYYAGYHNDLGHDCGSG
jgi:hypothetical protein